MNPVSCIYKIVNNETNKVYIGSTIDFERRKKDHIGSLSKGKHHSILLQRSFNKHKESAFSIDIIEVVDDINLLITREQYFLDKYTSYDAAYGYNICSKAGNSLGTKRTEQQRLNISNSLKGKPGRKPSKETRDKLRDSKLGSKNPQFGKPISEQTKLKISAKFSGPTGINFGRKHSAETRARMSEIKKGVVPTVTEQTYVGRKLCAKKRAALSKEQVLEIRKANSLGSTRYELMKIYGLSYSTITRAINGSNTVYKEY